MDFVAYLTSGIGLLHVVQVLAGLKGNILKYRPSAGYIKYLHPTADGEYRFSGFQDFLHEPDLKEVQGNICLSVSFLRFLPK